MVKFSIDRGGTFTDIYAEYNGRVVIKKLLSIDKKNYEDAPREGIKRVLKEFGLDFNSNSLSWIRMGTTVATNALLERKGAKTALLITKGFKDILKIGYQSRKKLFELNIKKAIPIYERVVEVDERVIPKGNKFKVLKAPNYEEIVRDLITLKKEGFDSIAIVFMHSYGFDLHEREVAKIAKEVGFEQISISSEVLAIVKVVDRGDSSTLDAYLTPHIKSYIREFKSGFSDKLKDTNLFFMQSNGGLTKDKNFRGVNSILSGPAGGVVGYASIYDKKPIIGFDMGGTSTDVSRYDGELELSYDGEIDGIKNRAPQLDILTVASGGGSRLFYKNSMFVVGPESASAEPGPVCYKKGGYLTITDANLVLNRILPNHFPKIFGKDQNEPLDYEASLRAFEELTKEINREYKDESLEELTTYEVALGFVKVANENMIKPIQEISIQRGFDIKEHILASFGGAGGQHACAIAKTLGVKEIFIHRYSGILSAYGIGMADIIKNVSKPINLKYNSKSLKVVEKKFKNLIGENIKEIIESIGIDKYLTLRYANTSHQFIIKEPKDKNYERVFKEKYLNLFGFDLDRDIDIDEIKVKLTTKTDKLKRQKIAKSKSEPKEIEVVKTYFEEGLLDTKVYNLNNLFAGDSINAPAIIIQDTSTILIEPNTKAIITEFGDVKIVVDKEDDIKIDTTLNPINLALFNNLFMSIAEQMGKTLQKTSISTNIKERLDFSCAIFDSSGNLIANAPHIPVHLGSISQSVKHILKKFKSINSGDVFITNAPYEGGSHLPDITIITPYIKSGRVEFFVANRAHHADIGGITPGSMPSDSNYLWQEGAIIESFKIVENSIFEEEKLIKILNSAGARSINDNISDIKAQISANKRGVDLLIEASNKYSLKIVKAYMQYIQNVSEEAIRELFKSFKDRELSAIDYLDDGTEINLKIEIKDDKAIFDFSKSGCESFYNQNTPKSITYSAVVYALRCLIKEELPLNEGFLKRVEFKFAENSILNPSKECGVVGGNVTTSQRIVDVIFMAFGVLANSTGCMNNFSFGNKKFGYYETIAGGMGATAKSDGASAIHTHMTNTKITDGEILERRYPVILREFSIRENSGGKGFRNGGDGVIREIEFLEKMRVNILSERRSIAPNGINGGKSAKRGKNLLIRKSKNYNLNSKVNLKIKKFDRIRIESAGGGGYGKEED